MRDYLLEDYWKTLDQVYKIVFSQPHRNTNLIIV